MTLANLQDMLMWCSLINIGLMLISFLFLCLARQWVYRIHSKFFPITESQFNIAIYCFLGIYKLLIWVFCIIPWIAVSIII